VNKSKLVIPQPSYTVIQREDEGSPVYAAVNSSLTTLTTETKKLFSWQLSLILDLGTEDDKGLPQVEEEKLIEPFCQQLEVDLLAGGNAIPLARITWKKTRELLFRVYNPAAADALIQKKIDAENNPRPFTYTIDPDEEWKMADDYLERFKKDLDLNS